MKLEVIIDSVESAIEAEKGGADRLELCANLVEGGTTPSKGTVKKCIESVTTPINVMIRPRGGDFLYSEHELEIMKEDIAMAKALNANGVVIGLLNEDGGVDVENTKKLVALAQPMEVTFHRAIDMSNDLLKAVDDIIKTGANRILTSGGQQKAEEASSTIAEMVKHANGKILIMAGSGVNDTNIKKMISETGADEFHVSCRKKFSSDMKFKNDISMSGFKFDEYSKSVTDADKIKTIKSIIKGV